MLVIGLPLAGAKPRRSRIERISGSALAKFIAENKVGNNVLYVVGCPGNARAVQAEWP